MQVIQMTCWRALVEHAQKRNLLEWKIMWQQIPIILQSEGALGLGRQIQSGKISWCEVGNIVVSSQFLYLSFFPSLAISLFYIYSKINFMKDPSRRNSSRGLLLILICSSHLIPFLVILEFGFWIVVLQATFIKEFYFCNWTCLHWCFHLH